MTGLREKDNSKLKKKYMALTFKELMTKQRRKVTSSVKPSLILPGRLRHSLLHYLKYFRY